MKITAQRSGGAGPPKAETMKVLKLILKTGENACLALTVTAMGLMVAINFVQIFFRYVLDVAFVWVLPATMMLMIWMVFLGAFVIYRRKKDIVVRFVVMRLPQVPSRILTVTTNILVMTLLVAVILEAPRIFQLQSSIMQVIPLPRYTKSLPLFIGLGGILLDYLVATLELLRSTSAGVEGSLSKS